MSDKLIDRVLKLLAKAESTDSQEEADALVAKATEIMVAQEITEAMLARAQGRQTDEIIERKFSFSGSYFAAVQRLALDVGRGFGFRTLVGGYGKVKHAYWVGYRTDIERAEITLTSLMIQQSSGMQRWGRENADLLASLVGYRRFAARRAWMLGFAEGAGAVIGRARRAAVADAKKAEAEAAAAAAAARAEAVVDSESDAVALVLRDKQAKIDDWIDEKYGRLRAGRSTNLTGSSTAWSSGYDAGQRADVGRRGLGAQRELGS